MKSISALLVSCLFSLNVTASDTAESYSESPIITYTSANGFNDTVEMVKQAIAGANYRLIREQSLDDGLVDKDNENRQKVSLYFCNFNTINELISIDPRIGAFLPCRITVVQDRQSVKVMSVNPKIMGQKLLNNSDLKKKCEEMSKIYRSIIEDATI